MLGAHTLPNTGIVLCAAREEIGVCDGDGRFRPRGPASRPERARRSLQLRPGVILDAVTTVALPGAPPLPAERSETPRFVEFLLVGGATLFLFPLAWLAERSLGLDAAELAVGFTTFHAAHLINDPHFSVTYLLFYRDARARALGAAFEPAQRVKR